MGLGDLHALLLQDRASCRTVSFWVHYLSVASSCEEEAPYEGAPVQSRVGRGGHGEASEEDGGSKELHFAWGCCDQVGLCCDMEGNTWVSVEQV